MKRIIFIVTQPWLPLVFLQSDFDMLLGFLLINLSYATRDPSISGPFDDVKVNTPITPIAFKLA